MRITGRERLDAFCTKHANARPWIENWVADVEAVVWRGPQDIRSRYSSASFLPDGIVIFNVKGNAYRLEARVAYAAGVVSVLWIGTHRAYYERNRRR